LLFNVDLLKIIILILFVIMGDLVHFVYIIQPTKIW